MAGVALRRLIGDVKNNLYEKVDNDAKAFRFITEETEDIRNKIKYINKHLTDTKQHPKTEREQILCYGNLGTAYYKLGDYIQARSYYMIQLEMAEEYKDVDSQRMAHANLGVLDKMQFNLNSAIERYNKSLDIALKAGNRVAEGRLYNNIANIHEMTMNFDEAIEYQKKRYEIAHELIDRDGISKSCACLAALYHTLDDWENAIKYYGEVMDQSRKALKIIDTLADDASGSEDGGYVNIDDEEEGGEEGDGAAKDGAKKGKAAKIKGVFTRKKKGAGKKEGK